MSQLPTSICLQEQKLYMDVCLDPFNKRVRVDDYRGNIQLVLSKAEELVQEQRAEKLIIKGRCEDIFSFYERGFQPEVMVDRYFLGTDAWFFTKFYTSDRKKNDHWLTEDGMIHSIYQLDPQSQRTFPPKEYELKKADSGCAPELAALYQQVFQIYPTPLNDPEYIKQTMEEDRTIYYAFFYQGKIVSAASAEINSFYKNAELTDCATLTEHRKYGLMKLLLQELEQELIRNGIYCAYSIARALSFGMNAALYQLGYKYRGRLMNNVYIYDKLEDMNMWVKNLANC